jgi:hypothetical protein
MHTVARMGESETNHFTEHSFSYAYRSTSLCFIIVVGEATFPLIWTSPALHTRTYGINSNKSIKNTNIYKKACAAPPHTQCSGV